MRRFQLVAIVSFCLPPAAFAAEGVVSVERGAQVAVIGGCHDCHTDGYNESNGKVDPAVALKGKSVGFQGPWGTTYAANLRITVLDKSEDFFVTWAKTFEVSPPMPWYNVHAMDESDLRSLYRYIKSLGDPGTPVPLDLMPGGTPRTPYIVFAPPTMPK
jgi:mono/diheme cytochrome c family protein